MPGQPRVRKRRTYNTRLIKRNLSYTIQEIAELFDLHVNAVRQWIKAGLPKIDDHRPHLIHGGELIEFLNERQAKRKHKCAPGELYCCRCRSPQKPQENAVNIKVQNETQLFLSAICAKCGARMQQIGTMRKLDQYHSTFTVQTIEGRRIRERFEPGVMCHLDEEKNNAQLQSQK